MEGFRDRADDALRKAAAPTLERIRKDAEIEDLPVQVRRLLVHFSGHLFDLLLTVTKARKDLGIGDNSVSTEFRSWLGWTPSQYLRRRRLETAARMLAATDLPERRIARAVGFTSYDAFASGYKAWTGKAPSQDRKHAAPEIDPPSWHRILHGELTLEEARLLIAELRRLYPESDEEAPQRRDAAPPRILVDGADYERFRATELWRRIRGLPFDEQKRHLRGYLFRSTVLFDLLRKTSREEGRKDREFGIRIAELALVSLEGHDDVFGGRIHDLRALGWAWLANARRLAFDFDGAAMDHARADEEWSSPRGERDLAISAEIRMLKGSLRQCQCRYAEAHDLLSEATNLASLAKDTRLLAEALIHRAVVNGYAQRNEESRSDLRDALSLSEGSRLAYLAFASSANLANIEGRLGEYTLAIESLETAKRHWDLIKYRFGWYEIRHLEGNIKEGIGEFEGAEKCYKEASSGFAGINEYGREALVSLDRAILYMSQGRVEEALELASSIPVALQTMTLHTETIAAIAIVASDHARREISRLALNELRRRLHDDPWVSLNFSSRLWGQTSGPTPDSTRP
jgi:AraC-like DNA-binding protein/tetratricopeptide (TPR) repeat protein